MQAKSASVEIERFDLRPPAEINKLIASHPALSDGARHISGSCLLLAGH